MKYFFITSLLFICVLQQSFGQTYTIKGTVADTLNAAQLPRASVVLIRTSDSVIQTFTRTKADGSFQLKVPAQGKYILQVTFPSFADYVDVINVKKSTTDYGAIPMVSKEHLLKEFVLKQQVAAIKIKGDTTEYMADSFKVKDGATVEDLLKRLPGIQVDKNGQITAQGETVQKILVDGEEFFSDDPKVVTQGMQAGVVEKVQVYDKKSDQTDFTGIDDGQRTKTINLELKEDKKKGYFGKIDAGGGTDGYFQDQGMINAFKAKEQFSVFGIMSNTDKVGLGWQDNNSFSSGSGVTEITDEGQVTITSNNSAEDLAGWDGKYNGEGLPQIWTGGVHFADKWDGDKEHFTGNYRYAMQNVDITGTTVTQNPLPNDGESVIHQNKNQFSRGDRHGLDLMYEWKIDSLTSIKLTATAGEKNTDISTMYNSTTLFGDTLLSNTNKRKVTSNANADFVNADLLIRRKFAKKGRTLSVDIKENYKDSKSDGHLTSFTNIYTDTVPSVIPSYVSQQKTSDLGTLAFAAKATYTEPLSKVAYLEADYGVTVNNSNSANYSYDSNSRTGRFDTLDKYYSTDYKYNILTNMGGLAARFVYKEINFSFGSDISNSQYFQSDAVRPDTPARRYAYLNYFPKATFVYKVGRETNLRFNYLGSTTQPTIDEISPQHQNTDPTNQTVGNQNLKQQFTNAFSLRFNNFKILSQRYLFGSASFNTISDAISTNTTNINGIRTTQYVNVNGNYNGFAFLGYGFKLKKIDLQIGAHLNAGVNHINSYINDSLNHSNNNTYTFTLDLEYYKDKKFTVEFNPSVTYNDNKSSITAYSTSYWTSSNELSGSVQLPWKLELSATVNWFLRQQTTLFYKDNNVLLCNAYIGKKLRKKSDIEIRASVFDIFNQNVGYDRNAQAGIITENTYNTIRRYGMLSLIWNFSHTPAGAPPPPGGGMMMMRR